MALSDLLAVLAPRSVRAPDLPDPRNGSSCELQISIWAGTDAHTHTLASTTGLEATVV